MEGERNEGEGGNGRVERENLAQSVRI